MDGLFDLIGAHYDLTLSVIALVLMVVMTVFGKFIAFKVPALARMKLINEKGDAEKIKMKKYMPIVKKNRLVGFLCNVVFFVLILPFVLTVESMSVWAIIFDVILILMVYDFFYYLVHRFWFHGDGPMRKIHALHHQARQPTYIDAHYVHPMETFIGLTLIMATVVMLSVLMGPFHVASIVVMFVLYTQLNTINHTFVDLPYFPFKTLSWITKKHHVHHENMQMGNYASLTMLYDRLFGTLD